MSLLLHEMLVDGVPKVSGPFRSTWRTAAAGETITLPLSGGAGSSYNFVVDWGDGAIETITSATDPKRIHHYAAAGDHQIKITGTLIGWAFNNGGDKAKIRSIDQWGCLRFLSAQQGHFYGCLNLTITATDLPTLAGWCASMFQGCTSLSTVPNMASWDMSNVTYTAAMFMGCTLFNQDISLWNTKNLTSAAYMFSGCRDFNQPIGTWNTSSIATFEAMFQNTSNFNQPLNLWNVSKAESFRLMFSGASKFNQPLNLWVTSSLTNLESTFQSAGAFNSDISTWNTSKVTTMSSMFRSASAFNQAIGGWVTSAVTNMSNMFLQANSFNQDISGWDTRLVTNMNATFQYATAFNCGQAAGVVHTLMQRNTTGGWRIGGITSANLASMFSQASSFAGDISNWCADVATTLPTNFAVGAHGNFTTPLQPTWGVCPIPD